MQMNAFTAKVFNMPLEAVQAVWKGFKTMATDSKIPRVLKRIGTHSGVFHCDEALACFLLKQLPEYEDAEIVRTRDSNVLETCDVVIDVGGVYNHKNNRYDHHQRGFDQTLSTILPHIAKNKHIMLSSAGLVYAHYGMEVISELLKKKNHTPTTDCLKGVFLAVYDGFIEELDAIDNGIPMYADSQPRYRINTHLSARVHRLNPEWNLSNHEPLDELFAKAVNLVGSEFTDKVIEAVTVWWPAREIVRDAIVSRKKFFPTGEIIKLGERCPWKDHLFSLEEELEIAGEIKFVIFHDATDSWRVQAMPVQPDSFVCRIFLHKDWRGIRDDKLIDVSGIEGSIFCHTSGFIGGNKTEKGALQMAINSLLASANEKD